MTNKNNKVKHHEIPVSVNLILEKQSKILLSLRHNDCIDGNKWGFVAGHLESGETPRQAMIREVKEELGISICQDDLLPPLVVHGSDPEYLGFIFRCLKWEGEIKNHEPHKCQRLEFFELNGLPDNIVGYVKKSIYELYNDNQYIEVS